MARSQCSLGVSRVFSKLCECSVTGTRAVGSAFIAAEKGVLYVLNFSTSPDVDYYYRALNAMSLPHSSVGRPVACVSFLWRSARFPWSAFFLGCERTLKTLRYVKRLTQASANGYQTNGLIRPARLLISVRMPCSSLGIRQDVEICVY